MTDKSKETWWESLLGVIFLAVVATILVKCYPSASHYVSGLWSNTIPSSPPSIITSPSPNPQVKREIYHLGQSWFAVNKMMDLTHNSDDPNHRWPIGYSFFKSLAEGWIRDNHERTTVFLATTVNPPANLEKLAENNQPYDVTIFGKCRIQGRDYKYNLSIHVEGIDDSQTVYVVKQWIINLSLP